ncbi:MAG TPA: preprotein translocase subunit SecY, partial [Chroococcales cyanobacterium]
MIQAQVKQAFLNLWQATGIKEKMLFTFAMIALFRFGVHVPIGGVDHGVLEKLFGGGNMLAGFLDLFSGGALAKFSVFALGITPYINASIIVQLMTSVIPKLEEMQKEGGEAGRKQLQQITRYLTLILASIQAFGLSTWLWRANAVVGHPASGGFPIFFVFGNMIVLISGTVFIMWIGELITENGIGNGASLLIMIGILSRIPHYFNQTAESVSVGATTWWGVSLLLTAFLFILVAIVVVQEGARRIPVQAARKQVGGKTVQGRASYIPLKVNQGGVMPIIFASSLLLFPVTIAQWLGKPTMKRVTWEFWTQNFWHWDNIRNGLVNSINSFMAALSPTGWL